MTSSRLNIDIKLLRQVIKKKGYTLAGLSSAICKNKAYLNQLTGSIEKSDLEKICSIIKEDPNRFIKTDIANYPIEMRTEPKGEDMGTAINKKEFMKMLTARWGDPLVADDCWQHYEKRNWKKANGKPVKSIKDCAYGFEYYNENLAAAAVKNGFELGNGNPFAEELYAKRDAEMAKDTTEQSVVEDIDDIRNWCRALEAVYSGHEGRIKTLSEELKKSKSEIAKRDAEIERLNGELSDLRERLMEAENAVESLEDHYKSSQRTISNRITNTATEWKNDIVGAAHLLRDYGRRSRMKSTR